MVLRQELSFTWDISLRAAITRESEFRGKRVTHIIKREDVFPKVRFTATGITEMSISSTEHHNMKL